MAKKIEESTHGLDNFISELSGVGGEVVEKIMVLADKHDINRDDAIRFFAMIFEMLSANCTFKAYTPRQDNAEHQTREGETE